MSVTVPRPDAVSNLENFIDGRWVAASPREWLDDVDPATGQVVARIPLSGSTEVDAAADAAIRCAGDADSSPDVGADLRNADRAVDPRFHGHGR